jgi:phenylacetate-CoA ligase
MNLNFLKELYSNSPYWLKCLYSKIPFSLRNGPLYNKWRKKIYLNNIIGNDPISTVQYAITNFQFYKDLYHEFDTKKFENLPLLTKDKIQESLIEFEKKQISKFYVTTGGVTGNPAKFYQSRNVWFKELAFLYNYFEKFGYKPYMTKASFRGGDIYNPIYNDLHFSPFHLNKESVYKYVSKLNKVQPKYFHGYPSTFLSLGKLMLSQNLKLKYKLNVIFMISEGFKDEDAKFLKSFFDCEVSSFYGHSERAVFAIGDENLESYTPNPIYGYVELVDENNRVIKENNIEGEIIGTTYDNLAMPLIRYKTGDFTHYLDFKTKKFAPISGKWGQNILFGFKNEKISLTALNLHTDVLDDILKVQYIQEEKGIVNLYIMFKNNKRHNLKKIENLLIERVGGKINFRVFSTDVFKLNLRGKAPLIINKIVS